MTATLTPYDIARLGYSTDATIRWIKRFVKSDFNDVAAGITVDGLKDLFDIGQLVITRIRVYLHSTTSGTGHDWIVGVRIGQNSQSTPIGLFRTTATEQDLAVFDCYIPIYDALREAVGTMNIVSIEDVTDPPTAHTADDMSVILEGFSVPRGPTPMVTPRPQAVSIEGYKWPLERIR